MPDWEKITRNIRTNKELADCLGLREMYVRNTLNDLFTRVDASGSTWERRIFEGSIGRNSVTFSPENNYVLTPQGVAFYCVADDSKEAKTLLLVYIDYVRTHEQQIAQMRSDVC